MVETASPKLEDIHALAMARINLSLLPLLVITNHQFGGDMFGLTPKVAITARHHVEVSGGLLVESRLRWILK